MMADQSQVMTRERQTFPGDNDDATAAESADMQASLDSNPVSLDGCLYCRRSSLSGLGLSRLKRRFVSLSLSDGGSIKVFKDIPTAGQQILERHPASAVLQTVYSKVHRSLAYAVAMRRMENLELYIPVDLDWVAKDVDNDSSSFVVEIPSSASALALVDVFLQQSEVDTVAGSRKHPCVEDLREELKKFNSRGEKPWRVFFRCSKGSHEKALWLKACSRIGRLSTDYWSKKTFFSTLSTPLQGKAHFHVRTRRESHQMLAQDTRHLDLSDALAGNDSSQLDLALTNDVEKLIRGPDSRFLRDREYRVLPTYAYRHRWMTRSEINEEMILPSEHFHDLRVPGCQNKEIGSLRIEVLQCLGLPKLDRTSDTDAVVYLVCGCYAFITDVIPNRKNPVWLRKARRACEFPLFHGYDRLYVGVFDNDMGQKKDDFAGRVVIDLARLRPRSSYDVTLPLRLSAHVYSRRKRGAIRLRFTLNWNTERDALLSYLPKSLKVPLPQNSRPNFSTTVNCTDEKAFRNIAITVHGAHLPGRFTFHQMRASIRELNFIRKYVFTAVRQEFLDTRHWKNPAISFCIFCAWMHCVYVNAFSLVPAYLVLSFVVYLMRTYAKHVIQIPSQTGFIPPSWEELLAALLRGVDREYVAIEPLELSHRPAKLSRRIDTLSESRGMIEFREHIHKTYKPGGESIYRALGFLNRFEPGKTPLPNHLEFPFSDASEADYPKFGTKECLVDHRGEKTGGEGTVRSVADTDEAMDFSPELAGEKRFMSRFPIDMPQFPIDMPNIPDMIRKDSSGLKEFDEEEYNFTASRAVVASGKKAAKTVSKKGKRAARTVITAGTKTGTKISEAAFELTEMTGLNHVVTPISDGVKHVQKGVHYGVNQVMVPVQKGVNYGMNQVIYPVQKGVSHGVSQIIAPVSQMISPMHVKDGHHLRPGIVRRGYSEGAPSKPVSHKRGRSVDTASQPLSGLKRAHSIGIDGKYPHTKTESYKASSTRMKRSRSCDASDLSVPSISSRLSKRPLANGSCVAHGVDSSEGDCSQSSEEDVNYSDDDSADEQIEINPSLLWPEQNIDIEGPSTGKKLTDDLVDIKDKIHEMTWHLFDDYVYYLRPNVLYFRQSKKSEKRRKKDVKKQLDKLLKIGAYSHSNPFVARVGLYVDPIVSSLYSFLCLFRAGFNALTWQDPMLTFWLSLFAGILSIVLFFFPWRHFFFALGFWFVGPQNWIIRLLREHRYLPSIEKRHTSEAANDVERILDCQPVITESHRKPGNDVIVPATDPLESREIHSVVVPSSPLMYQRFYDWPPEPMFAQVQPDMTDAELRRKRLLENLQKGARRPSMLQIGRVTTLYRSVSSDRFATDRLPPTASERHSTSSSVLENQQSKSHDHQGQSDRFFSIFGIFKAKRD